MKFNYAPGLPGYGTQGVDGSDGLPAISFYFSEYDGETGQTSITTKITNNQFLFTAAEPLPAGRSYQYGDMFVDVNGKAYVIDPDASVSANLFFYSDSRLNTSTIFSVGPLSTDTPVYNRYSNAYASTDKFLVDTVYSNSAPANYALSPGTGTNSIYGVPAVNFARVNYADLSIGNYIPYEVFTDSVNPAAPEKAIALTKRTDSNTWHLGNLDNGSAIRSGVDLALDFETISTPGEITSVGGISFGTGLSDEILLKGSHVTISNGPPILLQFAGATGDASIIINQHSVSRNLNIASNDITSIAGTGGALNLLGGRSAYNATTGNGGDVNISGGEVRLGSGTGGDVNINGGNSTGTVGGVNIGSSNTTEIIAGAPVTINDDVSISGNLIITGDVSIGGSILNPPMPLATKIVDIGDWPMDVSAIIEIAHGVTLSSIRSVDVWIQGDAGTNTGGALLGDNAGSARINSSTTHIELTRTGSGLFDNAAFDSTSYNRGWITIRYIP